MPDRRQRVRLIVASPDESRILARPNGLAGWCLPAIAVDAPFTGWTDAATAAARSVLSATVVPEASVGSDVWSVRIDGRIPAAGNEWIPVTQLERLGVDATAVRAWIDRPEGLVDGSGRAP